MRKNADGTVDIYFGSNARMRPPKEMTVDGHRICHRPISVCFLPDNVGLWFIQELQALFESERVLRQDRAAVVLTARTCCDAWELHPLAPRGCKKLAELKDDANEKERDSALDSFGECVVSTRNMLSHSKANYEPTGSECSEADLPDLVKCLRVAARQLIHYFHGVHPDRRVV
jgi:hypothetical protein